MKVAIPPDLPESERGELVAALEARGHCAAGSDEAEAVLLTGAPLTLERLEAMPRLRKVVRFARGRPDLAAESELCAERGLAYRHIMGTSAGSAAEHAVMMMLALLRRADFVPAALQAGSWPQAALIDAGLGNLDGARIGLIGMGAVGRRIACLLRAFGPEIAYHAPRRLPREEEARLKVYRLDLDPLLAWADIVSVQARHHDPAPILDGERISRLRSGAIVINVGDGRSIDLSALFGRVAAGELRAGLDVYPDEPWHGPAPPAGILATPHIAGRGSAARRTAFAAAAAALDAKATGAPGENGATRTTHPLLAAFVAELGAARPLAGRRARLRLGGEPRLAPLAAILERLGCDSVETVPSEAPARIDVHPDGPQLRIELASPTGQPGQSTGAIPVLTWLTERWQADFAFWERILPGAGAPSVPGRRLAIAGYGRVGRLAAWRAREIGATVKVHDPDPLRQLDALRDGFERGAPEASADLSLDTTPVAPETPLDSYGDEIVDALATAAAAMLCGLAAPGADPDEARADADRIVTRLLLDSATQ